MTSNTIPQGRRFSLTYSEKGVPGRDSPRARKRFYRLINSTVEYANSALRQSPAYLRGAELSLGAIVSRIEAELGVSVPYGNLEHFLEICELSDFLDTITIGSFYFKNNLFINVSGLFLKEASRILSELNLAYKIDSEGGVHPIVDMEFEESRVAAINLLMDQRYAGVLKAFEGAHASLEMNPPNGKNAIRSVFEAVEVIFKLMFPNADRIGESELKKYLDPFLQRACAADTTALRVSLNLTKGLADWINAAHWYRHGQGAEEPVEPPIAVAIAIMGVGAVYLRWLAGLDIENRAVS